MPSPSPPSDPNLRGVARGYRQRQILRDLLTGNPVIHPLYWRGRDCVSPRWQEWRSFGRFLTRLREAGYTVERQHLANRHEAYTVFTLTRTEASPCQSAALSAAGSTLSNPSAPINSPQTATSSPASVSRAG